MAQGPETREQILRRSQYLNNFLKLQEFGADAKTVDALLEPEILRFHEALEERYTVNGKILIFSAYGMASGASGIYTSGTDFSTIRRHTEYGLLAGYELRIIENIPVLINDLARSFMTLGSVDRNFVRGVGVKSSLSRSFFQNMLGMGTVIRSMMFPTDQSTGPQLPPNIEDFIRGLPPL